MEIMLISLLAFASSGLCKNVLNIEDLSDPLDATKVINPKLSISNEKNVYYVVPVQIGTPSVTYHLVVDTGSTYTWVKDKACVNCNFTKDPGYNSAKSKTSKQVTVGVTVSYEDGSTVQGTSYTDTISIGGASANVLFLSVLNASMHYTGFDADGILGLGFSQSVTGYQALISALKASGSISQGLFSLFYNDDVFIGRLKATLTLGAPDMNTFGQESTAVTIPVGNTAYGLWNFLAEGMYYGTSYVSPSQVFVFLDSSQEWIFAAAQDYPAVVEALVFYGFTYSNFTYSQKCNNTDGFPSFFIWVGGDSWLQIPSYRYLVAEKTGNSTICHVTISQSADNNWYLGDALFRTYYSIFSLDNSTMTFALSKYQPKIKHKKKHHHSDDGLAGWAIALIVISCVIGAAAIGGLVWFLLKRRDRAVNNDSTGKPLQEVSLHA